MAVAGGAVPAFMIRYADKRLIFMGSHNAASGVVCEPAKAIRELRAGRTVYLRKYGDNRAIVEAAFTEVQPEANR